jgi:hypothetical protein
MIQDSLSALVSTHSFHSATQSETNAKQRLIVVAKKLHSRC